MEAPDQFNGMIGVGQLLAWLRNAVPWVLPRVTAPNATHPASVVADGPDGFRRILASAPQLVGCTRPEPVDVDGYFAVCLACHHASVGSFVPTDVDGKIRSLLWRHASHEQMRWRWRLTQASHGWDLEGVSTRFETSDQGPVSGHDGEWLAVAGAALAAGLRLGDAILVDEAAAAIDAELAREAAVFSAAELRTKQGRSSVAEDLRLLRLAWILTHNAGDTDQGLSHADDTDGLDSYRARFGQLAHRDGQRYGGAYLRAKALYQLVAAEGHRHYPLRQVKALRGHADLLLPLPPCLEDWGHRIASSEHLGADAKLEVLAALATGIAKVPGQHGYQRAIHGMLSAWPGGGEAARKRLPTAARKALEDPRTRQQLQISASSFASSLSKRVRSAVHQAMR
jgi:hypothetical protein